MNQGSLLEPNKKHDSFLAKKVCNANEIAPMFTLYTITQSKACFNLDLKVSFSTKEQPEGLTAKPHSEINEIIIQIKWNKQT